MLRAHLLVYDNAIRHANIPCTLAMRISRANAFPCALESRNANNVQLIVHTDR